MLCPCCVLWFKFRNKCIALLFSKTIQFAMHSFLRSTPRLLLNSSLSIFLRFRFYTIYYDDSARCSSNEVVIPLSIWKTRITLKKLHIYYNWYINLRLLHSFLFKHRIFVQPVLSILNLHKQTVKYTQGTLFTFSLLAGNASIYNSRIG